MTYSISGPIARSHDRRIECGVGERAVDIEQTIRSSAKGERSTERRVDIGARVRIVGAGLVRGDVDDVDVEEAAIGREGIGQRVGREDIIEIAVDVALIGAGSDVAAV